MDSVEPMSTAECLRLLAGRSLGRVAYTDRALPAIQPVSYALVGTRLVLCTRRDGLAARLDRQVVAFEVDDADRERDTGWSVTVTGTARLLRAPWELVRLHPAFGTWLGSQDDTAVQITPGDVQGRRPVPSTTGR